LLAGYTLWGVFPIYFRALQAVSPALIIAYRLVLCCVFVLVWLRIRGELSSVRDALTDRSSRRRLAITAVLISINWLVYVWAVSQGRVVEASLGYFITPLLNVVLGVVVLGERLRALQRVAVGLAAVGVAYLTWQIGSPPYIALVLALSFSTYGLLRKTVAAEALAGLAAETVLITPLGAAYLIWMESRAQGAFAHASPAQLGLLMCSGAITAMPLWLFSFGARRVSLATLGLVSYLSPTLQFLVGVYFFQEHFDPHRLAGFTCIWCGLILYSADAVRVLRQGQQ
jgi:chloramphenicol-sensitive protein RarD